MLRSIPLGRVFGTKLAVHWTFFLLVAWVAFSSFLSGLTPFGAAMNVVLLLLLFACVLLHELGHATAAKYYGIPTRDITLLPIGGVARLERMPTKPIQELVVALAGPLVNVVIVAVLALFLPASAYVASPLAAPTNFVELLGRLAVINVILVVFNMIPAFPLDGGRVFRAVLSMFMDRVQATQLAAGIGQVFAIGLGLLGLFVLGNPLLALVAAFIFFAGASEVRGTVLLEQLRGHDVRDCMITNFLVIPSEARLDDIAANLIATPQRVYPVVDEYDGRVVGVLTRDTILRAAQAGELNATVGEVMETDFATTESHLPLDEVFQNVTSDRILLVFDGDRLVGMLGLEAALESIQLRNSLDRLHQATSLHGFHRVGGLRRGATHVSRPDRPADSSRSVLRLGE